MKKFTKNILLALVASMSLAGCSLTDKEDPTPEPDPTPQPEPEPEEKDFKYQVYSGAKYTLDGTGYSFAGGAKDGDVVHIEEANGKTIVYGVKGGVVTLAKGDVTHEFTINYKVVGVYVGSGYSGLASRVAEQFNKVSTPDAYTVGSLNKLFLDVAVRYESFDKTSWEEDDSADTDLAVLGNHFKAGEAPVVTTPDHTDFVTLNDDLSVSFGAAAVGQQFDVKFAIGAQNATLNLKVEEGYNAHNHAEFKSLFEDTTISGTIFLVRNIKAELSADRFYEDNTVEPHEDGSKLWPKNLFEDAHDKTNTGSVYNRVHTGEEERHPIKVNGNYLMIDAREVPGHCASKQPGQRQGMVSPTGTWLNIPNNGEGVFFVRSEGLDCGLNLTNVKVTANSDRSLAEEGKENAGCEGLASVVSHNTKIELHGAVLDHSERGLFLISVGSGLVSENSSIVDCWGSGALSYEAAHVKLTNSYIARCGGPAIHNIGCANSSYQYCSNTKIYWDFNTKIDNWIDKATPWCKANSVDVSGQLNQIEGVVSNWGSIFDNKMWNFVALSMPNSDHSTWTKTQKDIEFGTEGQPGYFHNNELPVRFEDPNYLASNPIVGGIYGAVGCYVSGLGQDDSSMLQSAVKIITEECGGVQSPETVQYAWATSIATYCMTQMAYGHQAFLDVTASIPGMGSVFACCEVKAKTL